MLVPLLYFGRKFWAKTKIVPLLEVDRECTLWTPLTPVSSGARFKDSIDEEVDETPKGWGGWIHRALF